MQKTGAKMLVIDDAASEAFSNGVNGAFSGEEALHILANIYEKKPLSGK